MYAVIMTGGKQYKVSVGDVLEIEKLDSPAGESVELPVLMVVDGESVTTGADISAKVVASVIGNGKGKKITVFKYKPKKNYRRKKGHRQQFTRIKIESIG